MPNLFSAFPVEILACVFASMSGLSRMAMGAFLPFDCGDLGKGHEFLFGLDVETMQAFVEAQGQFGPRLPDTREGDAIGRYAGRAGAPQLALGHHVHPGAEPREEPQDCLIRVRLHGETRHRPQRRERFREAAVLGLHGGPGIAVEGRADLGRDAAQIRGFGVEHAIDIREGLHAGSY